jgi:hypothetical protein
MYSNSTISENLIIGLLNLPPIASAIMEKKYSVISLSSVGFFQTILGHASCAVFWG